MMDFSKYSEVDEIVYIEFLVSLGMEETYQVSKSDRPGCEPGPWDYLIAVPEEFDSARLSFKHDKIEEVPVTLPARQFADLMSDKTPSRTDKAYRSACIASDDIERIKDSSDLSISGSETTPVHELENLPLQVDFKAHPAGTSPEAQKCSVLDGRLIEKDSAAWESRQTKEM